MCKLYLDFWYYSFRWCKERRRRLETSVPLLERQHPFLFTIYTFRAKSCIQSNYENWVTTLKNQAFALVERNVSVHATFSISNIYRVSKAFTVDNFVFIVKKVSEFSRLPYTLNWNFFCFSSSGHVLIFKSSYTRVCKTNVMEIAITMHLLLSMQKHPAVSAKLL